jgi:hypothetical protein
MRDRLPRNYAWRMAIIMLAGLITLTSPFGCAIAIPSVSAQSFDPRGTTLREVDPTPPSTVRNHIDDQEDRLLFSEDFEAYGDSSRWNRSFPFTVQQEIVANGSYAARLTNSGGDPEYGRKRLDEPQRVVFVRLKFRLLELGAHPVTLFQLRASDTSSIVSVRMTPDREVTYLTGATGITSTGTLAAYDGDWNTLQVMIDTSNSEQNLRIWLNEVELTTMRQDAWLGGKPVQILEIGDNRSSRVSDIALDDILLDSSYIPSTRAADPVGGTLTVRTSMGWEGVTFELDGQVFTTDAYGVAIIQVERWSPDLRRRIIVHDIANDELIATFSRWHEWISVHSRDVLAAFDLWQPISFSFVDMFGSPVDPDTIDEVTIKSSVGELYRLDTTDISQPFMLISNVATSPSGLHSKPITYYVDQVLIDGANVVNRSQQRTTFDESQEWTISLLFFTVRFQAYDALFGTPLGDELIVQSPDGTERTIPLNENGTAIIPRLPRGDYEVSVVGGGYSPPRPIRISRDQTVLLEVISQRDAMVFGGVAVSVVAGLVLAGRPFIVTASVAALSRAFGTNRRQFESKGQP